MHTQFVRLERIAALFSSLTVPFAQLDAFITRFAQLARDRGAVAQESLKNMNAVSLTACDGWGSV